MPSGHGTEGEFGVRSRGLGGRIRKTEGERGGQTDLGVLTVPDILGIIELTQ